MFQKAELECLRLQKDLLVLQSDAHRLVLTNDWQQLCSPETWVAEAGNLARRHPVWTTALATVAGVLAVRAVRKPGALAGGLGQLVKLASVAFTLWRRS